MKRPARGQTPHAPHPLQLGPHPPSGPVQGLTAGVGKPQLSPGPAGEKALPAWDPLLWKPNPPSSHFLWAGLSGLLWPAMPGHVPPCPLVLQVPSPTSGARQLATWEGRNQEFHTLVSGPEPALRLPAPLDSAGCRTPSSLVCV